MHYHQRFASRYLSTRRDLIVYVPPGYGQADDRYPVLYLQDGQNLFDPTTAFGGQDWYIDTTADQLICEGRVEPLIMVGIYNTGVRRISEYTPTRDARRRKGGKAGRYAEMLAREIKPFIDHQYRTRKPASDAGVGGSSLGALASLVAGLKYPKVFGKLAIMSPSIWWDNRAIIRMVEAHEPVVRAKVWLDCGTEEGDVPNQILEDTRALRDALVVKGWAVGAGLNCSEIQGAGHNEQAWGARFGQVLEYLFPVRT